MKKILIVEQLLTVWVNSNNFI